MSDGKIHIPARRKQPVDDQMVVKVTPEAYNALVDIYNESTLSLKQIASLLIVKDAVIEKYGRQCDVIDLVLWIAIRVQTLHDMWEREKKNGGN